MIFEIVLQALAPLALLSNLNQEACRDHSGLAKFCIKKEIPNSLQVESEGIIRDFRTAKTLHAGSIGVTRFISSRNYQHAVGSFCRKALTRHQDALYIRLA